MPGWDVSTWKAAGAGRWRAARRAVWAVAVVGVLALDSPAQQPTDPALARLLRELHAWADELATMPREEYWEDELVTVARAQARAGDPTGARATLQRAIARARDASELLAIEKVQAEMGDRDVVLKTLLMARNSDLAGAKLRNPGRPSTNGREEPADPELDARAAKRQIPKTLADIAIEQSRLGDRGAAKVTLEQAMQATKAIVPEDRNWAIGHVIYARTTAGDFDAALDDVASIADRAERLHALEQINLSDRVVDAMTLGRILRMIEALGDPAGPPEAPKLSESSVSGVKIAALIAMARARDAADDRAGAVRALLEARQAAEALEDAEDRYSWLGTIARAMVRVGEAAEASRMAGAVGETDRDWKWRILREIAEAHAEIGDPANRVAWDEALRASATGVERLRVLLERAGAQIKAGDREAALRTLEQSLAVERGLPWYDLRPFGDREFLEAGLAMMRAEAGDIAGSIRLAGEIEHVQKQGYALSGIAAIRADSGDIKGAYETAEMIRPPDPGQGFVTDLRDREETQHLIMRAQARGGDVSGALATLERLSTSREQRRSGLLWIAEGLGQRKEAGEREEPPRGP